MTPSVDTPAVTLSQNNNHLGERIIGFLPNPLYIEDDDDDNDNDNDDNDNNNNK